MPASGILVNESGEILMQRRRDTGQWAIPVGKQEFGETYGECAVRETEEETGIVAEVTGLLGVYSGPHHIVEYSDDEIRQQYEAICIGRPVGGVPTIKLTAYGGSPQAIHPRAGSATSSQAATPTLGERHNAGSNRLQPLSLRTR